MLNQNVISRLEKMKIPINENLPEVEPASSRDSKAIAIRTVILSVLLAISDDKNSLLFFKDFLISEGLFSHLSSYENSLFLNKPLTERDEINLSWSQEGLYALSWCLGIFSDMSLPFGEGDLEPVFPFLPPEVDVNSFFDTSTVISEQKILEELEFYYRLHWAKRHPEAWSFQSRISKFKKLNMSVIIERRRALEWVIDSSLDWDQINLNT